MSAASASVTTMSSAPTTPMYAVVVFPEEEDGVGMVPVCWMIGEDQSYWPPYKTALRFEKAVRYLEPPNTETWAVHSVRVIKKSVSYAKGRRDMARAEETSDIQTEIEEEENRRPKRKRTARKIFTSSSEDSDVGDNPYADPPATNQMVSQAPQQPDASHLGLTPTSAMQTPAPARQTPAPARQTPAPARQTPAPARHTPAPARQTPAPARQTPARQTPAPVRQTPARQIPALARQTPAPARQTPAR
ncbi:uncharacterized protein [Apostichopus japonicus]|uniref:uncharacterized protein n=1 Tax=Stichopus japonicus TaxID=307972 RepID=UPI003AB6112A